jgi:hypothetical protein
MEEEGIMHVEDGPGRQKAVRVRYPPNSQKSRELPPDRPRQEKIITGNAVQRKSFMRTMAASFTEGATGNLSDFIVMEIIVPAVKNVLFDITKGLTGGFSQGIERMLYGTVSRTRTGQTTYTNYGKIAKSATSASSSPPYQMSPRGRITHQFDEIVIPDRDEALNIIDRMQDILDDYPAATVADLYDFVGISSDFPDHKWGWTDLRTASIRLVRGGYLLVLPRPVPLD